MFENLPNFIIYYIIFIITLNLIITLIERHNLNKNVKKMLDVLRIAVIAPVIPP
jgi:hypothetical protein